MDRAWDKFSARPRTWPGADYPDPQPKPEIPVRAQAANTLSSTQLTEGIKRFIMDLEMSNSARSSDDLH